MTETDASLVDPTQQAKLTTRSVGSTVVRVLKYSAVKLALLFLTVTIGIYLTVLIANMGGYVDRIRRAQIREAVALTVRGDRQFTLLPEEEREELMNEMIAQEEERLGLNQPFIVRSFRYLGNALTLNLGFAEQMTSDSGSKQVRVIILERLPPTLLLWGVSGLLLFFVEISVALSISRKYGTWVDKFFVSMAPFSTSPGWFFGIFLILIFAAWLGVLPFGGMVSAPPPKSIVPTNDPVTTTLPAPSTATLVIDWSLVPPKRVLKT